MNYCKTCVLPDTKPGITFDKQGICSACRYVESKKNINWESRQNKLKELCGKMVDREYKNTEDGKELLALDEAHQQAQDMIWSAGSQSEQLMKMISATLQKRAGIDLGYKQLQIEADE